MVSFLKSKKIISFLLAAIMLWSSFSMVSVGAAESSTKNVAKVLESGIYRIKNSATGKYIDTYDFKYDELGRAYLDVATGQNGQDFRVDRQSDGTYAFYALTEKEPVALVFSDDTFLRKDVYVATPATFDIFALTNGLYTVALAFENESKVLGISEEKSEYGHSFVEFCEYDRSEGQQWEFIKVNPTGISLSQSSMTIKPYTLGDLVATVYPSYITDDVQWSSSDESVIMIDSDGSYCALKEGSAVITATCNGVSTSCTVNVSSVIANSWFSQHNIYTGGWNALSLKGIYFYAGGRYKPYIMDKYNSTYDWMDEGCLVCCIAMLLKNSNATLENGYDIRTGKSGDLEADPYTVSLANAGSTGATSTSQVIYGNPVCVTSDRIATRFKVDGKPFEVTTTYYVTKKAIKEALDRHPEGIIVGMKKWGSSHYLLFTKCVNPDEANPNNYKFIVCDPASYSGVDGDHVLFEKSYSYLTLGYRFNHMVSIEEWNLVK